MTCRYRSVAYLLLPLLIAGVTGCADLQSSSDYEDFRNSMPRSILVLPPTNDSIEVNASYVYLSTITRPLAEAGYYVFPVAVVDNYMKDNGLPTPNEMNSVSLDKIGKVFGADAVLYVHIEDWGQKYQVISSTTVVKSRAKLVDVQSGGVLWQGVAQAVQGSGDSGGGLLGYIVTAAIDQVMHTVIDRTYPTAVMANTNMIFNPKNGLLHGPYHREYTTDMRGR